MVTAVGTLTSDGARIGRRLEGCIGFARLSFLHLRPPHLLPVQLGSTKSVAIIGGGVSGLTAAYKLKSKCLNVILFEPEGKAGGKIRSNSENGFLWDEGANTMTESERRWEY